MPDQQNSAACSLRYLSQPHEDGAHLVRPVHVHIGTEIRLDRVDDDQSGVVLDNAFSIRSSERVSCTSLSSMTSTRSRSGRLR